MKRCRLILLDVQLTSIYHNCLAKARQLMAYGGVLSAWFSEWLAQSLLPRWENHLVLPTGGYIPPWKWTCPLKRDHFKRKFHLPTTFFFRRDVSFRVCVCVFVSWSVVKKGTESTLGCLGELLWHDGWRHEKTHKASSFILGKFRWHDNSTQMWVFVSPYLNLNLFSCLVEWRSGAFFETRHLLVHLSQPPVMTGGGPPWPHWTAVLCSWSATVQCGQLPSFGQGQHEWKGWMGSSRKARAWEKRHPFFGKSDLEVFRYVSRKWLMICCIWKSVMVNCYVLCFGDMLTSLLLNKKPGPGQSMAACSIEIEMKSPPLVHENPRHPLNVTPSRKYGLIEGLSTTSIPY